MKRLIAAASLLLAIPALVWAQEAEHPYRGQGYLFFGFGTASYANPVFEHLGFGGEGFLYKGLGFGAEAEYVNRGRGTPVWVGSTDFSYHFGRHVARGKLDPFVVGGFSVVGPTQVGGGRGAPAGNFGGGVNWWRAKHAALRFEAWDVVGSDFFDTNVLSFRIGVTFR